MKNMRFLFLLVAATFVVWVNGQENTGGFKPSGKASLRLFSNFHYGLKDELGTGFEVTRAYLGYDASLSENLTARVLLDAGDPKDGGDVQYAVFVKNAFLSWTNEKVKIDFGIIPTKYLDLSDKLWGHRYIYSVFGDVYKMYSTADAGVSLTYTLSEQISADVMVANGEGFKKLQADRAYRSGIGTTIQPLENLTLRGYYDYYSKSVVQSTLYALAAYQNEKFTLAAEYNAQKNNKFVDSLDISGPSIYGILNVGEKNEIFARYDYLMASLPDGAANPEESYLILGVQHQPVKNVRLSLNFRGLIPKDDARTQDNYVYFNIDVKF